MRRIKMSDEYKKYYSDEWDNEVSIIKRYFDDGEKPEHMYVLNSTIDGQWNEDCFTYYSDALGTFNDVINEMMRRM